jgi:gluconolactonase
MNRVDEFSFAVEGVDHSEDVVRGPDGEIYAGGEGGQLYRIDVDRGEFTELACTAGFLLGVVLDGNRDAYACDMGRHEVVKIELPAGTVSTYSTGTSEHPVEMPNGLAFAADGTLYFSDSGAWQQSNGRLYAVSPDGETAVWSTAPSGFPNGVTIDPQGRYLYIIESSLPGVSRVAINPDGSAGEYEVLAELPGTFPDGVTLTEEGTLIIGCYSPDRIYTLTTDRRLDILAEDPSRMTLNSPVNVAFAGPNRDVLVVSSLGRQHLVKASLGLRGAELHYPVPKRSS